jgi:hypothetical protein
MAELPTTDRIARHISKGRRKGEAADGSTGVVDSSAFKPRADYPRGSGLEEYLSMSWLEAFRGEFDEKLSAATIDMRNRLKGFDDERSRIGILIVQAVHDAAALKPKQLSVRIVDPDKDPSHAGVYGMDLEDEIIAQELARGVRLYRPRRPRTTVERSATET